MLTQLPRYTLRAATPADEPFLWEMLYQAIHVPTGEVPPPRALLQDPSLAHYVADWGKRPGDLGIIAVDQQSGDAVGAVWLRLFSADDPGWGYVDDHTPELSISVVAEWRGQGLGRALLERLVEVTRGQYSALALSVDPRNAALRLYQRLGFTAVGMSGTSVTMRKDLTASIHAIFVGQPKTITDERGTWTSSIYRDPVTGPVQVQKGGLVGDKAAQPYHGGPDSAICAHLLDHYRFWNAHYAMSLLPGNVGENFTLDQINEEQVCAGDIVRVGTALVQVSGPRTPCVNQARRIGRADWVKLTIRENRTGFYLRVLEAGMVQPGDAWQLQERFNPDGSIPAINRCIYLEFDPVYAQRIAQMQGLGNWWKEQVIERAIQQNEHWTATMKG